jgi:hypothetical protein
LTGQPDDPPVKGDFKVRTVSEGTVTLKGSVMNGLTVHLGPSVCLEIEEIVATVDAIRKLEKELFAKLGVSQQLFDITQRDAKGLPEDLNLDFEFLLPSLRTWRSSASATAKAGRT